MQNTLSGIKDIFSGLKKEQKQMLVLAVIVTVVMLFVYVNMLLKPQLEGLFNTAGRVGKLKADVKKAESDIARIGQLKKSMASYSEKMDRYGEVLPAEESMPALLESLADMARSSNMKIVGVAPIEDRSGKPVRGQAYKSMPIAVNARAGFHELGKFFSAIENSGRFMKVADISIKSNKASPKKHDVELVVVTYTLPEAK
jgi:Tfp pilus assembly protein PilO